MVRLGDHIKLVGGGTPSKEIESFWNGNIPWVSVKDMKDDFISSTADCISEEGLKKSASKLIPAGTLLIATRMAVGRLSFPKMNVAINQDLKAIYVDDKIDSKFLYYSLKAKEEYFNKISTGATVKGIKIEHITDLKIPLPSLSEQKRIAELLDAADTLRKKDKALLEKYDQLAQSLFLEMFGDPVKNEKGWEKVELNQLVSKLGDGLHGTPNYDENGEYYFVNGNNLVEGKITISPNTKRVNHTEFLKHQKDLNESTILVSINGSIGKTALYNQERIILGKSACYFNIKAEKVNKIYILSLVSSEYFLKYATDASTGSTIKNVSLKTMREFPVLLPPISLQNQFAEQVQLIERQKEIAKKNLEKSEELMKGLMGEVFK